MKVGAFGSFAFRVSGEQVRTWQSWSENHSDRWQTIDVIGDQRLYHGGRNLADVNIEVDLDPARTDVEEDLAELEALRGKAHSLVLSGKPIGPNKFVLLNFRPQRRANGGAKVALSLKEYK